MPLARERVDLLVDLRVDVASTCSDLLRGGAPAMIRPMTHPTSLRLQDTLSGQKKPFVTQKPGEAQIYVCGPTTYDYAHLGHARCYLVYDVLVRHLRATGLKVKYVRNITDIDDNIIKRAAEAGKEPLALAAEFAATYHEDFGRLGYVEPDVEPKVSEHLPQIFAMVQTLIDKGHAYQSEGDVYFAVDTFSEYGKLSHRDMSQHEDGASARLDTAQQTRKKNSADFALWKGVREDEVGWDSPFGRGRPGWHIECSAMSTAHIGETLDLHGGGLDLVFPHHENEIAQSECATGACYSTHWMHNGFVEVDKTKMSKSLGNFFTARELFERVEPEAIRLFMMTVHYRAPINLEWTLDDENRVSGFPQLEEAERRLAYLYETKQRVASIPEGRIVERDEPAPQPIVDFPVKLKEGLDDDLNMPVALAAMSELLKTANELVDKAKAKKGKVSRMALDQLEVAFVALEAELGLGSDAADAILVRMRDRRAAAVGIDDAFVQSRIVARAEARASKDFDEADAIRAALIEKGVELHDAPTGTT